MKHIKKFSELVTESSVKAAEIQEVVKKLGYGSLEEIQQEKTLLTKLESLMKELAKSSDVSEDEAEEIEDEVIAKGSPKSLANKMGEKEEDGEPGGSSEEGEVAEDAAEEIDADVIARGEPKKHSSAEGETVVTQDQEVEEEPETSPEDEDAGVKIPKARIMSFEEFVKEQTVTVNKNVSYRNDAEEEDDALPVAEDTAEEIEDDTFALGEPRKHSEAEGEEVVTLDQEIEEEPETADDESDVHGIVVTEQKISNEKEFEEYAMEILKKSHPDDFDQEVADKVVSGLKSKYKSDFGAMVGALQSSMGK